MFMSLLNRQVRPVNSSGAAQSSRHPVPHLRHRASQLSRIVTNNRDIDSQDKNADSEINASKMTENIQSKSSESTLDLTQSIHSDISSIQGKFGWIAIGDQTIPFIVRGVDKQEYFVSTRTVNIIKYLTTLHSDIFCKCLSIESYSISHYEVRLLNYLNDTHCDFYYGHRKFTSEKDFIVRLDDVVQLYTFLNCCTLRLTCASNKLCANIHQFGFIHIYLKSKINSFVPYFIKDGHWCIPVFYLEGQINNLQTYTFELTGWDLMYLKFCCRIQGIKETFYKQDSCMVVRLDNIISYFKPATVFQDYWPSKTIAACELWHSPTAELLISPDIWFKKPYEFGNGTPVEISPSSTQETSLTTGQQAMPILPSLPNIPQTNTSLSLSINQNPSSSNDVNISTGVSSTRSSIVSHILHHNYVKSASSAVINTVPDIVYTNAQANQKQPQPDLLDTTHVAPEAMEVDSVSQYTQACNVTKSDKNPEFKIVDSFTLPTNLQKNISVIELIRIQERDWQLDSLKLPYEVTPTMLRGNTILFINKLPYDYSSYLVTLKDVVKTVIPFSTIEICGLIFQNELHKTLYCGNTEQISLLYRNGAADNQIPIMTPLIQLCDVTENIEQLQQMANFFHTKYSINKIMV